MSYEVALGIRNSYNIFQVVSSALYPNILFWRCCSANAARLLFYVNSTIAPCIDYIKFRVDNFHLYFLIM